MKIAAVFLAIVAACSAAPSEQGFVEPTPFNEIGGRIISGEAATAGQFPWQVALLVSVTGGTSFCGGSLIGTRHVLTAAHCTVNGRAVDIRLGSLSYATGTSISASQVVVHSDYVSVGRGDDVSVVQLSTAVTLSSNVAVIPLNEAAIAGGTPVTVSGWGLTSDTSSSVSQTLNFVSLTTITNNVCGQTYGTVPGVIVCTTGVGSRSTCNGDSGGPLIIGSGNSATLVGVVSFGHVNGCSLGYPAGFSRISAYRDWIRQYSGV